MPQGQEVGAGQIVTNFSHSWFVDYGEEYLVLSTLILNVVKRFPKNVIKMSNFLTYPTIDLLYDYNYRTMLKFNRIFVDRVERKSYNIKSTKYDFHSTPSTNIHLILPDCSDMFSNTATILTTVTQSQYDHWVTTNTIRTSTTTTTIATATTMTTATSLTTSWDIRECT